MYRRTWVLEPDKLHDGAQPVAIEVAKAWLIGRSGVDNCSSGGGGCWAVPAAPIARSHAANAQAV